MLIVSKSPAAVGHGRLLRGPAALPSIDVQSLAATYSQGIYMRPNQSNEGTVPAGSPLSACPDIWIAGMPVPNYQSALATATSYATQSADNITQGHPNYIYIRGKNGTAIPRTTKVQLYGVPCAAIQWPSNWANFSIPTDQDHPDGTPPIYVSSMVNLGAGTIGVAADTFVWANPQPPTDGSSHYCLITWLNNANNPFPDVLTQLDMSALITNNLQFGWRNVSMQSAQSPTIQISTQLIIPDDVSAGSREYSLQVTNNGFAPNTDGRGWTFDLTCSRTDAKGKSISIVNTAMPDQGHFVGVRCWLEPGYSATLTLNLYRNSGPVSLPGASMDITPAYYSDGTKAELEEALQRGLVDFALSHALHSAYRGGTTADIRPRPVVLLGADGLRIK
ncbi:hypothetical protein [Pseudomonas sp. GV085]|jgi:hypothetical protein|uniref:hypothetical protein n=1 Tax=Pseudomonas sp. GV085 TaxID=2135756 RepID=UPI000D3C8E45|nr:hypothetical protein [Pseudomonas sp. GV085]PTR23346.1 hypothetical protein C8K63_108318 [Pseudomonas sp. GV085]